ncbi:conserved hypothetical protein [Aster yellows witches'-broom phytoplasma AYWB]|uniref:Uncharacterized protein n=2 Tax=16SrI (Aster yellows group) TaxID=3042590 RepID=Q2NJK0_AYWBP|nr:hypothetical protein [Aster yellows witches'-broom phytoplasma]ABC65393.1 conserved hypothetical protein [Aster yellows witches'-broom phytoplasma AYWB]
MAKKIIIIKKTKKQQTTKKTTKNQRKLTPKTTKATIMKKTSTRITKSTPKTTKPIKQQRTAQPTKIIVSTQQKQDNWFVKIIKPLKTTILILLPLTLIVGGIYWVLFKFFPEIFSQINDFTINAATKTKSLYDKITQPIRDFIEYIHNKATGNNQNPNQTPSRQNKLGYYLATTLSIIGICLGIGKIGNWLKGGTKKAIRKGTKKIIQKKATSKIANVGSKICKIGGKILFWVSIASTAYELYQFYQEGTRNPNPPQQLENKNKNPNTHTHRHEEANQTTKDEPQERETQKKKKQPNLLN